MNDQRDLERGRKLMMRRNLHGCSVARAHIDILSIGKTKLPAAPAQRPADRQPAKTV
ncbi:hypothetical protein [Sorangium cellulosum]|uniref:hypothetical protein n=1 Tax=Sorangium TaxID=39643 RepID=UPI003D9C33BA